MRVIQDNRNHHVEVIDFCNVDYALVGLDLPAVVIRATTEQPKLSVTNPPGSLSANPPLCKGGGETENVNTGGTLNEEGPTDANRRAAQTVRVTAPSLQTPPDSPTPEVPWPYLHSTGEDSTEMWTLPGSPNKGVPPDSEAVKVEGLGLTAPLLAPGLSESSLCPKGFGNETLGDKEDPASEGWAPCGFCRGPVCLSKVDSLGQESGVVDEQDPSEEEEPFPVRAFNHAWHLTRCMCDAYGFVYGVKGVKSLAARIESWGEENFENVLKRFYSLGLSMVTGPTRFPDPTRPDKQVRWRVVIRNVLGLGKLGRFVTNLFHRSRKWWQHRKAGRERRVLGALSVGQTWLMLKKGVPVISLLHRAKTRVEYRKAIEDPVRGLHSRERGGSDEDVLQDDALDSSIRRVVEEVTRNRSGVVFSSATGLALFPSVRSHFDVKGSQGGAAAVVADLWREASFDEHGMRRPMDPEVPDWEGTGFLCYRGQEKRFRRLVRQKVLSELQEGLRVRPVQVLEPFKPRTVTPGPPVTYWVLREVQKFLWGLVKSHPTFSLIGEPIDASFIDKIDHFGECLGGDRWWLSGDYVKSTDFLRRFASESAWGYLSDACRFPEWIRRIGLKCLVEHTILDPDSGDLYRQGNGQLMGSPLSFPILCIVNAAVCRMSFDRKDLPMKKLPMLINGDDCVMRYVEEEKKRWERNSACAGLSPSPGKCYWDKEFCQMNSELFVRLGGRFYERVPHWNMGLTRRFAAKGNSERTFLELGSLGRQFSRCIAGTKYDRDFVGRPTRKEAITIFLRRQRDLLRQAPGWISWFLPKYLGGLGIPADERTIASSLRPRHRLLASFLKQSLSRGKDLSPLNRVHPGAAPSPWLQHALQARMDLEKCEVLSSDLRCWSSIDEEETWSQFMTDASYSSWLFMYMNRVSFASVHKAERKRFKDRIKHFSSDLEKRLRDLEKMAKDSPVLDTHALLSPFEVKRYLPLWVRGVLETLAPGPRGLLGCLPAHLPARSVETDLDSAWTRLGQAWLDWEQEGWEGEDTSPCQEVPDSSEFGALAWWVDRSFAALSGEGKD